ncbi:MAG TPA: hypothetical protein VLA89_10210 [Gemmatimonadales bacterium]|nr:hypothetical protein [Gemmatimonadales bacterium]
MGEIEARPAMELVLPSGELVDLSSPDSRAYALNRIREMESQLKEVKGAIVDAFAEDRERLGVDEIELEDGSVVKVTRRYDIVWDHQQLEDDLRAAGMPEERIREIIVEEVTWTVKATEANKAAKRNADYAKAVKRAREEVEKRPTISLPRG